MRTRFLTLLIPTAVLLGVTGIVVWAARPHLPDENAPPLPAHFSDLQTVVSNVDLLFESGWKKAGVTPVATADELQVLRRLSLALCGTVPSLEEIRQFETDTAPDRIARWTTRLLEDNRYADYFAARLSRSFVGADQGQFIVFRRGQFNDWLSQQLRENAPYDEIVRTMISETGLWTGTPATNFVTAAVSDGELDENKLAGRSVRAFLGQRIDCAQCHDHPFDHWKQHEFEGLASWFGQTKVSLVGVEDKRDQIYEVEDRKTLEMRPIAPTVPFHPEWLPAEGTRREQLAAWVTHPENRRFERATANRIWGLLFGKPYVEPVDAVPDPGENSPADLLDLLGADFRTHHYDLRRLILAIATSRPFRLESSHPSDLEGELAEKQASEWGSFPLTRLRPEQIIGSMLQASSIKTIDQNSHLVKRAVRFFRERDFVNEYGDLGDSELEDHPGTIPQALLRMNGDFTSDSVESGFLGSSGRIARFAGSNTQLLETCYLVCLARRPTEQERAYFIPQLEEASKGEERERTVEDIYWALFNSPEFSWNH
ncbi:MAG: DUF1549 domain-containing protein [Planctomycetaceae bacterium]